MSLFEKIANPWIASQRPYQPGRPLEEVARELGEDSIDGIVKLASNENSLGPSPKAQEAMLHAISTMHLYPDGGAFYARQAIAKKFGVQDDMVMFGCGCNEHAVLLTHAFMDKGDAVIVSERSFVVYRLVASLYQCEAIQVPMKGFTHDVDAMLAAITPNTKMLVIGNPNNPTGTIVTQEEIDSFMERVPAHVVTVFDEAYMELLDPEIQLDTIKHVKAAQKPVVTLRTFSKAYGLAGLRIGYAIAQPDAIDLLNKTRQPFNVNAMAQAAAIAALDDDEHLHNTRAMLKEGRAYLMQEMTRLGLQPVESVTNFILIPCAKPKELTHALLQRKVIIRPMAGFGLPDFVRVSVGTAAENTQFITALEDSLKELSLP